MREIVGPASTIFCAGGVGVAQLLQVAPSPGACAVPRAKAGVAPLTRATSARAANSVMVFIGLPSVCKYVTAYDLAATPHSDPCHELTTEPTSYGQWQVGVARPHHEILTERKVCGRDGLAGLDPFAPWLRGEAGADYLKPAFSVRQRLIRLSSIPISNRRRFLGRGLWRPDHTQCAVRWDDGRASRCNARSHADGYKRSGGCPSHPAAKRYSRRPC
jgi:hypothetical protein